MKEHILKNKTIKTFFVEAAEVDRLYHNGTRASLILWRALRQDHPVKNPLYPDFERRELRKGKFRNPDVSVNNGVVYPVVYKKSPNDNWKAQGTSLFDRPDTFVGKSWEYFEIPAGTDIPEGLVIIEDEYNQRFDATHYTIAPDYAMSVEAFKTRLDRLAQNARRQKGAATGG